jgi:hypothetical protein
MAERIEKDGWVYVRLTDSIVNAWQNIVEKHFDELCDGGSFANDILLIDDLLTDGQAREDIREAQEYSDEYSESKKSAYTEAKGGN